VGQTGLAVGVAILVAILGTHAHRSPATLQAFRHGWWVAAAISLAGIVPALALLPGGRRGQGGRAAGRQ
jgi:hypothetical protein